MIFFDAPVDPDTLTEYVRIVPTPGNLALTDLFGPPRQLDSNTVDFGEIVKTNRTAKYRSFDGRIHVSERDTGSQKRVGLAPLSSSLTMGEYERLQLEFARTGGTFVQALAAAVYNDATSLTNEVLNRMELAWGDVLTDGKLTIAEGGYAGEADYGVPAEQIVSPATPWSTKATATVLSDISGWNDQYVANNGEPMGYMLTSLKQIRLAQQNAEVINAIYGSNQGKTRVRTDELNALLESEGLPTLLPAYDTRLDVDGVSTRVLADNKVVFLPQNVEDLGYTAYGVSATALELVNAAESDLSFEQAPGIVGVVLKYGPPFRQGVFVDAVGQPILQNARLLAVATVGS